MQEEPEASAGGGGGGGSGVASPVGGDGDAFNSIVNKKISECLSKVFYARQDTGNKRDRIARIKNLIRKISLPPRVIISLESKVKSTLVLRDQTRSASKKRERNDNPERNENKTVPVITDFTDFMINVLNVTLHKTDGVTTLRINSKTINPSYDRNPFHLHQIAKGTYGIVYKFEYGGKNYIVKEDLTKSIHTGISEEEHLRDIFREALVNIVLQHDETYGGHVGRLVKVLYDRERKTILFVSEYIEYTLKTYIEKMYNAIDEKQIYNIDRNLDLINFLHSMVRENKGYKSIIIIGIINFVIYHDIKENDYPYTFTLFENDRFSMELQLESDGERIVKDSKGNEIGGNYNNILTRLIRAIIKERNEFIYPIFHTLGAVLNRFKNNYTFYHRDLHIGNIMVTEDGKLKLIDFGMSYMRIFHEKKNEPERYDLLILICHILQYNGRHDFLKLSRPILEKLESCFSPENEFVKKIQSSKYPIYQEVYYYSSFWRNDSMKEMFKKIKDKFLPENFKLMWINPGGGYPPEFIYPDACDTKLGGGGGESSYSFLLYKICIGLSLIFGFL